MTDKINGFLQETELKDHTQGYWGIGAMLARASAKPILSIQSVRSAQDQILISASREIVLPIIAETLARSKTLRSLIFRLLLLRF
jgi:hypothetical protein